MKKILILVNCILLCSSILLAQNEVLAVETTTSAIPSATPSAVVSTEELPVVHILPDNPLYFLKTIKEKIQMMFTRNTSNQADLLLDFAQKRLAEALKVAEKGKVHISEKLFEAFGRDIETAQEKIAAVKASGERTYGLLVKLQETVAYQKSVVEELQLDSFLVKIDQGLGEATESGGASYEATPPVALAEGGKIGRRLGIFDWLKGLFGKKEILSPLVR